MGREGERQRLLIHYKIMWKRKITIHPSPTNVTKQSESVNPWVITNSHHCYKKYIYIYIFFFNPQDHHVIQTACKCMNTAWLIKMQKPDPLQHFLIEVIHNSDKHRQQQQQKGQNRHTGIKKNIMWVQSKCIKSLPLKITITRNQSQEYRTHPNHTVVKLPVPYLILTGKIRLQYIILYNYYNVTCKSFKHLPKPVI